MTTTAEAPEPSMIESWSIDKIVPADDNVRSQVGDIEGLAESIKELGILEPLLVCLIPGTDQAMIMAGERRHAAAQLAGLTHVEVIVTESIDNDKRFTTMLVENLQREGLSALDLARGFKVLADSGMSQRSIAKKVGVSQAMVSKHLSLLKLPEPALQLVSAGELSQEDAVTLAGLPTDLRKGVVDDLEDAATTGSPMAASEVAQAIHWAKQRADEKERLKSRTAQLESDGVAFVDYDDVSFMDPKKAPVAVSVIYWCRDHRKAPCRAVAVTATGAIVEVCTDPSSHPKPKAEKSPGNRASTKKETPKEQAAREELERLRALLAEASERRVEWLKGVTSTPALTTAAVQIILRCDVQYFDAAAAGVFPGMEHAAPAELAATITTESHARRAIFAMAYLAIEELIEPSHSVFEASQRDAEDIQAYLEILTTLGYEVSWIEAKFAGLPYEEPQVPGTSSPATEEGASGAETAPISLAGDLPAETPAITITAKRGKHYLRCSGCPWTGVNTKIEMAEENRRVHLKETHGIGAAS